VQVHQRWNSLPLKKSELHCMAEQNEHPHNLDELNRKLAELSDKEHYLAVINSFASALLATSTVEETIWTVAKAAIARMGFVDCVIYLFDAEQNVWVQRAAHGPKNPVELDIAAPIILQPGEGIVGAVAITGKAEIVGDTSKDPRYVMDDEVRLSEISVPIIADGKVIGVIDSEHPEPNYYTQLDLEILTTIASMTAVKLMQAMAQDELAQHHEELEQQVENKTAELRKMVQQLQQSHNQLSARNKENETLLKEIHHRVKNNMQIVISLLNLSSGDVQSEHAQQVFKECQSRIRSMAMIHERLYSENDLSRINAQEYIRGLSQELKQSFQPKGNVRFQLELEKIDFPIDTFMPIGLIINELVVNALKYAFSDGRDGVIKILFKHNESGYRLLVADNGVGIQVKEEDKKRKSIGMELIDTLTEQLNGVLKWEQPKVGTAVEILFDA